MPDGLERVLIVIDDLDRCPPEKVVTVLEAVHLLFSFRMFVVLIAVDTRWLEQSLRIHYRRLLGATGTPAPTDYLEKIIQIPLHLRPLDDSMVRAMIYGLTGAVPIEDIPTVPAGPQQIKQEGTQLSKQEETSSAYTGHTGPGDRYLTALVPRIPPQPLPAEVMQITGPEANAMSAVAPLLGPPSMGPTPRTVKRFVNTYRLLKARLQEWDFGEADASVNGHLHIYEVIAFLLAVVTGPPATARAVISALQSAPTGTTCEQALTPFNNPHLTPLSLDLTSICAWLTIHKSYADAPASQYATWTTEVSRFTFTPPPS